MGDHQAVKMNDISFRRFVDKWVTPTTVITMFGAIVWGLTLTNNQTNLIRSDELQNQQIRDLSDSVSSIMLTANRQTLLLDQVSRRMEQIVQQMREHEQEAEKWKRRIDANSLNIENGNRK